MRIVLSLLALVCLPSAPAPAVEAAPFTAEDAVTLAVKQNPRLSAAAREVTAAGLAVRSARALTNPEILFTPALTRAGSDEELFIQQRLEINGTRTARAGVAQARLRQSQAEAVVALRDLVLETKSAYYELARARDLHAQARELLAIAEEFDRGARRQVEVGTRAGIDQVQTGIEVARARQQVALSEGQTARALATLNTLMGRDPAEPIGPLPPLAFTPEAAPAEAAMAGALGARTEIAAGEAARDAFRQEARLARAEGRPDLAPQFRAESLTRGGEAGVGIAVTLPLFDHGGRRNRVRQAEESARAGEERIVAARGQVRLEVTVALARLRAAETVIREYQQGVLEQAKRLVSASRVGLQTGATTLAGVLEAQRTYRSVLAEYTNALVEHALARAGLERAVGSVPADLLDTGRQR